jgi:hypothetical protein
MESNMTMKCGIMGRKPKLYFVPFIFHISVGRVTQTFAVQFITDGSKLKGEKN